MAALLLVFATAPHASAGQQQPAAKSRAAAETPSAAQKKKWQLSVTKEQPRLITLKGTDAPVSEIAEELGRQFKAQVQTSPLVAKQRLTIDIAGYTLDAALLRLAPQVYVDYEAGGHNVGAPKVLAIYLHALNEAPPSLTETVKGGNEALLVEGDTEEGTESFEEKRKELPLDVSYGKNALSVRAKRQPLTVVLYKVASEMGVPFELRHESPEMVDVEFVNYPLDQALRMISPHVRFYYRTDLQTSHNYPLRLALVAPAKS